MPPDLLPDLLPDFLPLDLPPDLLPDFLPLDLPPDLLPNFLPLDLPPDLPPTLPLDLPPDEVEGSFLVRDVKGLRVVAATTGDLMGAATTAGASVTSPRTTANGAAIIGADETLLLLLPPFCVIMGDMTGRGVRKDSSTGEASGDVGLPSDVSCGGAKSISPNGMAGAIVSIPGAGVVDEDNIGAGESTCDACGDSIVGLANGSSFWTAGALVTAFVTVSEVGGVLVFVIGAGVGVPMALASGGGRIFVAIMGIVGAIVCAVNIGAGVVAADKGPVVIMGDMTGRGVRKDGSTGEASGDVGLPSDVSCGGAKSISPNVGESVLVKDDSITGGEPTVDEGTATGAGAAVVVIAPPIAVVDGVVIIDDMTGAIVSIPGAGVVDEDNIGAGESTCDACGDSIVGLANGSSFWTAGALVTAFVTVSEVGGVLVFVIGAGVGVPMALASGGGRIFVAITGIVGATVCESVIGTFVGAAATRKGSGAGIVVAPDGLGLVTTVAPAGDSSSVGDATGESTRKTCCCALQEATARAATRLIAMDLMVMRTMEWLLLYTSELFYKTPQ